jgi:hypothetical protein
MRIVGLVEKPTTPKEVKPPKTEETKKPAKKPSKE